MIQKIDPIILRLYFLIGFFVFIFCLIAFPQISFISGIAIQSFVFYSFFLAIAGIVIYIFCSSFHWILTLTSNAVIFRKFERNDFFKHVRRTFYYYLGLTTLVFLSILSLIQIPSININQFICIFPITAALLVSLRFLANPTKKLYRDFWKKDPDNLSDSDMSNLRRLREQVISFYFSLFEVAVLVLIIGYVFREIGQNFAISYKFIKQNPIGFVILIIAYLITLAVFTFYSEYYLERWEPIPIDD